jgi:two-component system, cell cycle sensor histidine kinase and response regulator CckA
MIGWLARLFGTRRADPLEDLLLHDAAGPACVVDREGVILRANAALGELCGPDAVRLGADLTTLFRPSDRDTARRCLRAVLAGGGGAADCFTAGLAQGEDCMARVAVLPIRDRHGAAAGALLRLSDLTAQRQLEARLAHSQKLQATGQLAGGIAHDFNNLLTAVLGAAEGILAREPVGETREDAAQIRDSAQRGAALVRQLLAFGRQQRLAPRVISVNDAIENVCGLLRRLLGGHVRLLLALEKPGRKVRADPTQLDQVLINLAVNARDAMRNGGELTLRSGHITLYRPMLHGAETIPPGRYVMIEVTDTGEGIPAALMPRIFDPFFTTKRERGGSGLGLSTVHGIVRQSDGFLAMDSEPGRGTSVRIYLPRWDGADEEAPPPKEAAPPPAARADRGAVLLADDEDAVRRLAARALIRAGWQVIEADSGGSALESLRASGAKIQALVTDLVMPGMAGEELAQAVRTACEDAHLPVVMVSGYAETHNSQAITDPDTIFLAKPYSLADLVAALSRLVEDESKSAA